MNIPTLYFRRPYAVLASLLGAIILMGACASPAAKEVTQEPVKLKVVVLPFLSFAPFYIAQEEGFFTDQGLDVEFVRLSDSAAPLTALLQGDVDVASAQAEAGLLNAIAQGGVAKIVADKGYLAADACPAYALLARRDLVEAGELESAAQLDGRKLAIEPLTVEGYYVEKMLNEAGLAFDDIETENLPPPALSDALETGAIDLVNVGEPWITRIKRSGNGVVWRPVKDIIPDFQYATVVYGPNLLKENPDAGRRFMTAYLQAVHQYNEGKTDRNLEIISLHTELDRDLLEEACWPSIRDDGLINTQSVLDFQTWALEKDLVDNQITVEQFWDPSFVEYSKEILEKSAP